MSSKQSRSISIRLSMRTYNEIGKMLDVQAETGTKRERAKAALIRRRLERAPRLNRR